MLAVRAYDSPAALAQDGEYSGTRRVGVKRRMFLSWSRLKCSSVSVGACDALGQASVIIAQLA